MMDNTAINDIPERRSKLISGIKSGEVQGSLNLARTTAEFLHFVILTSPWTLAKEILDIVQNEEQLLKEALPQLALLTNVIQQVRFVIRNEYFKVVAKTKPSMSTLERYLCTPRGLHGTKESYTTPIDGFREAVVVHVGEYQTELELSSYHICEHAVKHIQDTDVIMTVGNSSIVESFVMTKASKKRPEFEVVVVEGTPFTKGHTLARKLATKGVPTSLIPDSSVFAFMPRVNKVIIGMNGVLGNGGLQAIIGTHNVVLSANYYAKPVIVLAPTYKISPKCSNVTSELTSCNVYTSPQNILSFENLDTDIASKVKVLNPLYDYVPPECISLFVSNIGYFGPTFMYVLIQKLYGARNMPL